jgi:hypothetical protein
MSLSNAAPQQQLWELWHLVLAALEAYFRDPPDRINAAYLNTARQFLKDNGIQIDIGELKDVRRGIAELRALSLPFIHPEKKDQ